LSKGLSCKVVLFPEGEDIDSLLRRAGKDVFENLRAAAPEGLAFCSRVLRDMAPRDAVDWAGSFVAQVELPELAGRYASVLDTELGLSESEFRERLVAGRAARRSVAGAERGTPGWRGTPVPTRTNVRDREIMTFAVRDPHALPRLRELGAYLALVSPRARDLWRKLEENTPEEFFKNPKNPRLKDFLSKVL